MVTLGAVVAAAVKAERNRLGLDQQELADLLNWSRTTVSNVENGSRAVAVDDIVPLCRALRVTFAQLIDRAERDDRTVLGL